MQPLAGKTFVLTGTLEQMSAQRGRAKKSARSAAMSPVPSAARRTTSSPARRGLEAGRRAPLGVTVLDEAQFLALLEVSEPAKPAPRDLSGS